MNTIETILSTIIHKAWVMWYLLKACARLLWRGLTHDMSKLGRYERPLFAEFTPRLAASTYGSDEYQAFLDGMAPALRNHYRRNDHHPEHWINYRSMSPLARVEMLCDWKAASRRHRDGDLARSIEVNADRFGYTRDESLALTHAALELGLLPPDLESDR